MSTAFDHQILDPGQARLRLRTDLIVTPHDHATFVIEDPLSGKFFLVGGAEWSFLTQIDGNRTIAEAIGAAATQAPQGAALTEREGIAVSRWLVDQGLAKPVDMVLGRSADDDGPKAVKAPFNPFAIKCGSCNPDAVLAKLDAHLGFLWSQGFLALWLCAGIAASFKLIDNWGVWSALPTQVLDRDNWLRMGVVWCLLKLLHELGHGLSCRHFGVPVRRAGLLLIFFAPVPYVDVSASWRLPQRRHRMAISAAGMYLELFVAFAALLLWNPSSFESADRICIDIVVLAGFNTLVFNANPLMRFDGYYILADAVGIPNLAGESGRYLSNAVKFWFRGWDVAGVGGDAVTRGMVKSYAFASFGWKCLTFFGIAISLIARWTWWGAAASVFVAWFWFGLRLPSRDEGLSRPSCSTKGLRRRKTTIAVVATAAALVVAWLASPAKIMAPAVVEYAPLTVVRATADGFVKQVFVREGETVEAGAPLLELVNDDLPSNVKRLEVELAQAELRSRAYLTQDELSKQQKELELVKSLGKQLREYRSQLTGLVLRAPCRATIASNDLAGLAGNYVDKGEVLVLLGTESRKELLVSAPSADENQFAKHVGEVVEICRPLGGLDDLHGRLAQVDPRLSDVLPHHALGAGSGGDVAVRLDAQARTDTDEDSPPISLTPRVVATVALDDDASLRLHAGQRVVVMLVGKSESWGRRMLRRWNDYLLEFSTENLAGESGGE